MAIKKYGWTYTYGFGRKHALLYSSGLTIKFQNSFTVIAESKSTEMTQMDVSGFKQNPFLKLYIVYDGQTRIWREYFTGIPLKLVKFDYNNDSEPYDVDGSEVIARSFSIANIHEVTATEFLSAISVFSETDTQRIAEQIIDINKRGKEWVVQFDKVVQAVIDERTRKEANASSVESRLNSGFGKYKETKNTIIQPDDSQTHNDLKDLIAQWKSQGRCAHCGGEFGGFFVKCCKYCGKEKDY